jgi:hypothetical protein
MQLRPRSSDREVSADELDPPQRQRREVTVVWDTVVETAAPLSHEMPCPWCGHATHSFLPCSDSCECAGWRSLADPAVQRRTPDVVSD